jgi:hypothetical protein
MLGEKFPIRNKHGEAVAKYYSLYGNDVHWTKKWLDQRRDLLDMIISECRKNIKLLKK